MVRGHFVGKTAPATLDNSVSMTSAGAVSTNGATVAATTVNGLPIRCMVTAYSDGKMVECIMVSL